MEQGENDNYWVRYITPKRKPRAIRNIWWILLGLVAIAVIMQFTNPKEEFSHNKAVMNSVEKKICPALMTALRHSTLSEMQSMPEDEKGYASVALSIAETLLGTDIATSVSTNVIASELTITSVKDHRLYSVGYHNQEKVTVGMFGHVWTIYDFMSEDKIAARMVEKLNL